MAVLLSVIAIRADTQDSGHSRTRSAGFLIANSAALAGRAGPYGGIASVDDVRKMLADGFGLAVMSGPSRDVVTALREGGAKYIDVRLWNLLYAVCKRQFAAEEAAGQPMACAISATDEDVIAEQSAAYLKTIEREPALAALWILDDFPRGDVTKVLRRLRGLVQESNVRSGFDRPTICGVGGTLDFKRGIDDAAFIQDHRYMDLALSNVSPEVCDVVSPYLYASAVRDDTRLIDWSMRNLLPYLRQALHARGYDTSAQVLLPIAHAFSAHTPGSPSYYVTPRPEDVTTQMRAYCDEGAASIMFFTWRSADADRSYSTDGSLRDGVREGHAACLQLWPDRSPAPDKGDAFCGGRTCGGR